MRILANIVLSVLVLALAAGGAWYFIVSKPATPVREPPQVVPTVVAPRVEANVDYRAKIIGFGSARPRVRLKVSPQVAGVVKAKAANFLSGKYVQKGQVLFQIDTTDYVLARDAALRNIDLLNTQLRRLEQEKANLLALKKIETERLVLAEEQLKRNRELLARSAAAQNDVDAAEEVALARRLQVRQIVNQLELIPPQRNQLEAEIALAKVQLAQAQTDLDRATVRSPISGRVLSCSVEQGERVQVGTVCGELYGVEVMDIPISIPAGDLRWIDQSLLAGPGENPTAPPAAERIPATAHWHQPGNGGQIRWAGFVQRIEAGLEAQTRTATLVIQVDNAPDASEMPMLDLNNFCKVVVEGKLLPKVFLLPRRAIQPDGTVFVVENGRLARRKLTVARFTDETAYVLPGAGIAEGDRVIIEYVPRPVLGMHVKAVDRVRGPAASAPAGTTVSAGEGT